jgi:hypothetical protein
MKDYSWQVTDPISQEPIPPESLPTRFALTATGLVLDGNAEQRRLLLCNRHPDTWNNWQLPYGTLVMDMKFNSLKSFGNLSECMQRIKEKYSIEYSKVAFTQVREVLEVDNITFNPKPCFENFSLKFSKSAFVWTAYYFRYHCCKLPMVQHPKIAHVWLPLDRIILANIMDHGQFEGLPVADNVVALLRSKLTINEICLKD